MVFNLVRGSFKYFLVLRNPTTKTQFEYGTNLSYFRLININSKKSKSQIISSNAGSTPCFTVADNVISINKSFTFLLIVK